MFFDSCLGFLQPGTPEPLQGLSSIVVPSLPDKPLRGVWEEDEYEEEDGKAVESEDQGEHGHGEEGGDGGVAEEAEAEGCHVATAHRATQTHHPHLWRERFSK